MPVLETPRLLIRAFAMDDLEAVQRLLDIELRAEDLATETFDTRAERGEWLQWTVLNYAQLTKLRQPPYGDRAVALKSGGAIIGACGFVPCLAPFAQIPGFATDHAPARPGLYTPEFGLFYAISPAHQRRGYASEAAQAMVEYAFDVLHLGRIIAMTAHDNAGSMGVMRRLGMRIERNPYPEPHWLQVVGILDATERPSSLGRGPL